MDIRLFIASLEQQGCFGPFNVVWQETARSGPILWGDSAAYDETSLPKMVPGTEIFNKRPNGRPVSMLKGALGPDYLLPFPPL